MGSPSPTFMHYDVSGAVESDIQGMNRQLEKDGLMKEFLRCAHTIQFTRRMMGVDHLTGEKICDDDLYCNVVLFREWYFNYLGGDYHFAKKNQLISELFKLWYTLHNSSVCLQMNYPVDQAAKKIRVKRSSGEIQQGWLEKNTELIVHRHKNDVRIRVLFLDKSCENADDYEYINGKVVFPGDKEHNTLRADCYKITKLVSLKDFMELNPDYVMDATIATYGEELMSADYKGFAPENTQNTITCLNAAQKSIIDSMKSWCKINEISPAFWDSIDFVPFEMRVIK